ncbi:MAG: hypothetical protein HZA80_03090 [Candidatus Taylorbacteria bacterium]|nr:hypothetical protein [Candidatus Taylorbacteria bacterium]
MKLSWFPRIGIFIVFIIVLVFAPWWVTVTCGLIAIIFIRKYFEIVFLGIVFDGLYGVPGGGFFEMYAGVTFAVIAYLFVEYIRSKTFKVQ